MVLKETFYTTAFSEGTP